MKRIGILTSGGDAPGMNSAIRATVRAGSRKNIEVIGIRKGYEGLINGDFIPLNRDNVNGIIHRGGTILKTARCDEFRTVEGMKKARANMQSANIDAIIVIGGDGSLRGACDFMEISGNIVLIPGTIDNDMGYTDYTVGFSSAVNTVISAVNNIKETGEAHDRATVIEVMGRHCGDIALHSGLAAGADLILIPELETNIEAVSKRLRECCERQHQIIIRSEGSNISMEELSESVKKNTDQELRKVVLSYLQRGGSPVAEDRKLATFMGVEAIEAVYEEDYNVAIGVEGGHIIRTPVKEAEKITREADLEMLQLIYNLW